MVVRFFPSDEERRASPTDGGERRERAGRAVRAPSGGAPIAYLPGTEPSERAQAALAAVNAIAGAESGVEVEANADAGRNGAGDRGRRRSSGRTPGDRARESRERAQEKAGNRAANVSLHQLARRGMSRWELEQVLRRREVEDAVAEAELSRLESVGLLDDAALAVSLVYAARARKGQGRQAIERELRRRHIDDGVIEDALSSFEAEEWLDRAIEVATKRAEQLRDLDDATAERRLWGYLSRRGYDGETIVVAVGEAMRARRV